MSNITADDIQYHVHRIVHSADSDTDDLIAELVAFALDISQRSYGRGYQDGVKQERHVSLSKSSQDALADRPSTNQR